MVAVVAHGGGWMCKLCSWISCAECWRISYKLMLADASSNSRDLWLSIGQLRLVICWFTVDGNSSSWLFCPVRGAGHAPHHHCGLHRDFRRPNPLVWLGMPPATTRNHPEMIRNENSLLRQLTGNDLRNRNLS